MIKKFFRRREVAKVGLPYQDADFWPVFYDLDMGKDTLPKGTEVAPLDHLKKVEVGATTPIFRLNGRIYIYQIRRKFKAPGDDHAFDPAQFSIVFSHSVKDSVEDG